MNSKYRITTNLDQMASNMAVGSDMDESPIKVISKTSTLTTADCISKPDLFEKPACLIYTDDKGLLIINKDTFTQLSQIDKKISVVGICGLYRTGKSFLMNLIAGKKKGFQLGNTIQSETKGIWIWCKQNPRQKDTVLVLMDTEGLDDPEKGDPSHDNNLFSLTLLLSSTLIINVKGVFDYGVLDKLKFITTLTERVKVFDGDEAYLQNKDIISVASPRLVMCIRDFFLKSKKHGRNLTPDEYLEENLKLVDSPQSNHKRFNKIKKAITEYFPKRKCFTIAQPATGEALQNIESLDEKAIDQNFITDIIALRDYVNDRKPKYICNASKKAIDGADFTVLIKSYVRALRENTPICCEDAYKKASKQHNKRVLDKVLHYFKKEMEEGKTMTSKVKLQDMFLEVFTKTLIKYRDESFLYQQDEFEETATEQMKEYLESMKDDLKAKSQTLGAEKLSKMYDTMFEDNKDSYFSSGGENRYERDMETLADEFFEKMKDYDKDDLCMALEEFRKSKQDERMRLYRAASEDRAKQQHIGFRNEINKKLNQSLECIFESEVKRRRSYLENELEKLRAENEELSKLVKERSRYCSVM